MCPPPLTSLKSPTWALCRHEMIQKRIIEGSPGSSSIPSRQVIAHSSSFSISQVQSHRLKMQEKQRLLQEYFSAKTHLSATSLKVAAVRRSPSAAPDFLGLGLLVRYTDSQIICAISNSLEMGDILMSCASQDGQPGGIAPAPPHQAADLSRGK